MKNLLVASANVHKIKEIRRLLKNISFTILSSADVHFHEDIEEYGKTYEENARIKAQTIGKKFAMLTLADDSGVEVDALNGRPGIYSARYITGSDTDRMNKLLEELHAVPSGKRTARYRAVIAIYNPADGATHTFEGACEGVIAMQPRGKNGFGYDPVFYSSELKKTFGEATGREKGLVSHRVRALQKSKEYLLTI